jgi:predicted helicase
MFEELMQKYLQTDPLYRDKYCKVWMWKDWPERGDEPDTGIDLVAQERVSSEYCAIQCKFFDPAHTIQKSDIDSFFTASGKHPFTSRIIISTTDKWSSNAEKALQNQQIPVTRLRLQELANSPIDWSQFDLSRIEDMNLAEKKVLRPHQQEALDRVIAGFEKTDRGKLIMACGTGKTFTSLKIAELIAGKGQTKQILFLVPSISLLSQTLREWASEADKPLNRYAICSDPNVGKPNLTEDIHSYDLGFPATTNVKLLLNQMRLSEKTDQITVIFSTYQSIKVVAEAQKKGLPEFDLIICDEAHRTTGATLMGKEESHFVRVHDQEFIKGQKRLYMTATPSIYSDTVKIQAKEKDAILASMDDEMLFGPEFHRLGFGEAVGDDLLSDYKVMVLAVDEKHVSKLFQSQIADENSEISLDDAVKIMGCWNGLSKRFGEDGNASAVETESAPMRRSVAFLGKIADSKKFRNMFTDIVKILDEEEGYREKLVNCEIEHVDGTFTSPARNGLIDWLKADTSSKGKHCRILSNVRCLSEGVDVPALDSVMFLNPRKSVVDVVQSVGRVMRKAPGKQYGYIILPIGIPADKAPEDALRDNEKYKVVWQVLQALRAHDDRFNATINQIELNETKPGQINVIGVGGEGTAGEQTELEIYTNTFKNYRLAEWSDAIYAKIVLKCGSRQYWETWAKDIAQIADRHIDRINLLLEKSDSEHKQAFDEFLEGIRANLNPSVSKQDAVEMLAQHLITKPVFEALFEEAHFIEKNPVSQAMQKMLNLMDEQALEKETVSLEKFYTSVKERVAKIDNAAGKQKVIKELYEKFFKNAFPRLAEKMGIVYTPIEVVDFIIKSADDALRKEFGLGLTDAGVHVLDPFTGTGTFIVRMLQSGLIKKEDLKRKYREELHANEILLLAYYIAAVNIEEAYHYLSRNDYEPFEGIVLTDTFQMSEGLKSSKGELFPVNNKRVQRQSKHDIRVIMGNPPYSAGQTSENDANKNLKYDHLDKRITDTYARYSTASNKYSLYDSYIRSFRWASDRIKDNGIICYVSNGSFLDSNVADGLRKCFVDEFSEIFVFNLRGNARTSGEQRRKEAGSVFGEGTRTPITITLLSKDKTNNSPCKLHCYDIGDYHNRQEKLEIIRKFRSISKIPWQKIRPNAEHDWINQRDPVFDRFIKIGDKKDKFGKVLFTNYSLGLNSNRDIWVYNYSNLRVEKNVSYLVNNYNSQINLVEKINPKLKKWEKLEQLDEIIENNPSKIKWSSSLKDELLRKTTLLYKSDRIVTSIYRPFCKMNLYFDQALNHRRGQMPKILPDSQCENKVIAVTGVGSTNEFSALISNLIPDLEMISKGQCFPLYTYEKPRDMGDQTAFDRGDGAEYVRRDAIPDSIRGEFRKTYSDQKIDKGDIFYYVYGILHSPEYKQRFEANLKKMLPRIPFAKDFWAFSKAGRELAGWHLNYETIEPYPVKEHQTTLITDPENDYRVQKMSFGKQGKVADKTTIVYNNHITLSGIPLEAYDYIVNGKSAIEWIMERYQVSVDKASQIKNDPNDWSDDPRYILDLLKRIVRVSLETMKIVNGLPDLDERNGPNL